MACLLVNTEFAIIDCPSCKGSGSFMLINTNCADKPSFTQDACGTCKGVGLVRVPLEDIPVLNLGSDYMLEVEEDIDETA